MDMDIIMGAIIGAIETVALVASGIILGRWIGCRLKSEASAPIQTHGDTP